MTALTSMARRARVTSRTLAATLCALVALAIGGVATASAAGPHYLNAGDGMRYSTWGWGQSTTVCAYNHDYREWGHIYIDPVYGDAWPDQLWIYPRSTNCFARSWWGNPIDVVNNGVTALTTWTR